ncbi:MAG: diadenylate cyclase CdaA [Clostridia bacterium]|nr:diadenylate cyclase CdaA [Clostridia bacterium]
MDIFVEMWEQICAFFLLNVLEPIVHIGWRDVLDIVVLAFLLYELFRFAKNRRAGRVMIGLCFVIFICIVINLLALPSLSYITGLFAAAAFFCIVVIFQPEIRDALERIGNSNLLKPGSDSLPRKHYPLAKKTAEEIVDAVYHMSEKKTGALIVFEGLTKLGDYIQTGKIVDARVTSDLIQNIFYDKAPLHDGSVVIRDMRIWAASCVLPSANGNINFGRMGTRHRAAVGVTEVSDALALIVSEETGVVSVAQDGKLLRDVDRETLYDVLMTYLAGRLYLRKKHGVHVDHFENLPLYNRRDEETEDMLAMGQMTIAEETPIEEVVTEETVAEQTSEQPSEETLLPTEDDVKEEEAEKDKEL